MHMFVLLAAVLGLCLQFPTISHADEDATVWQVGVRAGYTFESKYRSVEEYDLYLQRDFPSLTWDLSENIRIGLRGEVSVGLLQDWSNSNFVGSFGPDLVFAFGKYVKVYGGSRFTFLDDQNLGHNDFGGNLQFTSNGGILFNLSPTFTFGYRYQHMSNGGIYLFNPGLNLNMLEVGIRF
jgi:lipid A 3-O-deacylase